MLLPHHLKDYNPVLEAMNNDFREGFGVTHILASFGFSSGTLLPIAIAEVDGRVAQALSGMAVRYEKSRRKTEEIKKSSYLSYCAFYFYRRIAYGFPKVLFT